MGGAFYSCSETGEKLPPGAHPGLSDYIAKASQLMKAAKDPNRTIQSPSKIELAEYQVQEGILHVQNTASELSTPDRVYD